MGQVCLYAEDGKKKKRNKNFKQTYHAYLLGFL